MGCVEVFIEAFVEASGKGLVELGKVDVEDEYETEEMSRRVPLNPLPSRLVVEVVSELLIFLFYFGVCV